LEQEEMPGVTPTEEATTTAAPFLAKPDPLATDSTAGQLEEGDHRTVHPALPVTPILAALAVPDPSPARSDLGESHVESPAQGQLSAWTTDSSHVTADSLDAEIVQQPLVEELINPWVVAVSLLSHPDEAVLSHR
jgi:hypothetical protein